MYVCWGPFFATEHLQYLTAPAASWHDEKLAEHSDSCYFFHRLYLNECGSRFNQVSIKIPGDWVG